MHQSNEETMKLWREQCRRQMARPMSARLKYGFVARSNRDRENRVFDSMEEYRNWCEVNFPDYLGYGRATKI